MKVTVGAMFAGVRARAITGKLGCFVLASHQTQQARVGASVSRVVVFLDRRNSGCL